MGTLADRRFEMTLRNRVLFGIGEVERLPEVVRSVGGSRLFVVTDEGVRASGVIDHVLGIVKAAGLRAATFAEVEPNPGSTVVERGAEVLRGMGLDGTVVVPIGGGSSMDTAKAIDLLAANPMPVWDLEYDGPTLTPGPPVIAVPTTAGTGAETNSFSVITHEDARAQGLHRPPEPAATGDHPRPGADRRPAAGRHGRDRHRRDDPLAGVAPLGQPQPVRRGDGPWRHPDDRRRGCDGPWRTARTSRPARRC